MEDLLAVCVLEDAAGFAREETLEATALDAFLFPIMMEVNSRSCIGPLGGSAGVPQLEHELLYSSSKIHEIIF